MRKLASVQKINKIEPIDGADNIELVHVLGWQCVAKKGEFNVGDYCVYFEIDSFLPVEERFEFLRGSSYKNTDFIGEGFRLKTQKFRGQVSQGLALPCSLFPELWIDPVEGMACVVPSEGQDVTDLLHVRKYEIPERATSGGTIIGELPVGVKHTDEARIQAFPELLHEFAGKPYYITTKIDGSSHSVSIDKDGAFHVTGHNYEYKDDGSSSFFNYIKRNGTEEAMRNVVADEGIETLTIQGEWAGPGMQRNRLQLKAPHWFVFTIEEDGWRVGLDRMRHITNRMGLAMVPVEEIGKDLTAEYPAVEALLRRAQGQYPNGGSKEGIVIRPIKPVYCKLIDADLSMKVINNKYLLKNKD